MGEAARDPRNDGKRLGRRPESPPLWFFVGIVAAVMGFWVALVLAFQASTLLVLLVNGAFVLAVALAGALAMWRHLARDATRLRNQGLVQSIGRGFAAESGSRAFARVIGELQAEFACSHAAIAWIESWNTLDWLHHPGPETLSISREHWRKDWATWFETEKPVPYSPFVCPVDSITAEWGLAIPITLRGEALALILLGRKTRAFTAPETASLALLAAEMAPLISNRVQISRQEAFRKVTEKAFHTSEVRLQTILDDSRDMVLTVSAPGIVLYLNPAGATLLGHANPRELVGSQARNLWFIANDFDFFHNRILTEHWVQDMEVLLKDTRDQSHFCLASASAILSGGSECTEYTAIVKDVSDLINSRIAQTKANIELEEANRRLRETQALMVQQEKLASIGQLAAGIAHEINNPLAFIKSNYSAMTRSVATLTAFIDWLPGKSLEELEKRSAEKKLPALAKDLADIISESEQGFVRITDIVQNLRNFSRIDTLAERELFDINQGIQSSLVVARNEIRYVARVELLLEPVPSVYCKVNEINQVLLNLLVNAAQAIKSLGHANQEGRITIRTWDDGKMVYCEVGDDGPGIPEDIKDRIFDPFFTTKPAGQGTGLGLSISYDIIVKKHGGELRFDSKPGEGASFRFGLPIIQKSANS